MRTNGGLLLLVRRRTSEIMEASEIKESEFEEASSEFFRQEEASFKWRPHNRYIFETSPEWLIGI